jgi:hypothetical protein
MLKFLSAALRFFGSFPRVDLGSSGRWVSAVANGEPVFGAVLDHEKPRIPQGSGPAGLEPAAKPVNSGEAGCGATLSPLLFGK